MDDSSVKVSSDVKKSNINKNILDKDEDNNVINISKSLENFKNENLDQNVTDSEKKNTYDVSVRQALRDAMFEEMKRDDDVFIIGEEVAEYEGAYKVTQGLLKEFGEKRVVDTPINRTWIFWNSHWRSIC